MRKKTRKTAKKSPRTLRRADMPVNVYEKGFYFYIPMGDDEDHEVNK